MSTVKLQSSNTFNNFANDVESMPSSPNSPCSVFIDTGNDFRLGPYDLHESWPKMSGGASPSSALPKKKKKSDAKPQSQINKCLNEKRRREQENIYIEELAELISASFADMSSLSVKPDKCAILQETVKQNRRIKPENSESLVGIESAVQQGEVSSSKQSKISNTELAPLLLSALEGFLLVVSADGRIEFVSDNIEQFLNYNQEELIGESVYNFIHHGDHTRFGVLLNKLLLYGSSIVSPGSTHSSASPMDHPPSGSKSNNWNHRRFTTKFNCRLLVKPQSDQDQTIEEKQTRVCQYKTLQISSTKINGGMLDDEENTEGGGQSLLCIAQHALNEKHLSPPLEQFTFKLDQNGKILSLDTQNVSNTYAQYMNKDNLVGRMLHEQCHKNDSLKVINHIKETRRAGSSTSPIYKLHLVDEKYINVQTKSKYFMKTDDEMEFIMAIISIIGDSEMCTMIENHSSAYAAASAAVAAVTDPLGVVSLNGTDSLSLMVSGPGSNHSGSNMQSETKFSTTNAFNMTPTSDLNFSDFPLFQSTTFSDILQENKWPEQAMNVVETLAKTTPVPSPATISSNPHTPTAHTPYTSFPFSPLIPSPKDTFDSINNAEKTESARLRTLLMTTKRADGSFEESKHNILKGLLNQPEMGLQDEESMNHHSTPPSPANSRPQSHNSSNLNDTSAALNNSSSNNMLLKLLNDKSEDEDLEARVGIKKQNELLQQLLKEDDNVRQHGAMLEQNEQQHSNEEHILKDFHILPPTSPDSLGHSRKRNSVSADDENDRPPLKRSLIPSVLESMPNPSISSQPQVPTNSKLRERNKMLASLLAKDPPPTAIPAIPASVISATPQDKLVNIIKQQQQHQQQQQQQPAGGWNSNQHSMTIPQQRMPLNQLQVHQRGLPPKSANNIFLNHMLDQQPQSLNSPGQLSNMQMSQMRIVTSTAVSGSYNQFNNSDSNINLQSFNSDPELSELLEEVMDIMVVTSETTNAANTAVGSNTANQGSFNSLMNEKMAVSEIQKCLMQVESTVKSPAQLNYGSPTGNGVQAQNQFIPPPAYQPQQKTSVRFNQQQSPRLGGVGSYPKNQQQQLLLHQQQKQRLIQQQQQQQQQQKQRLLQQQQQQKMVVSSNSAAISTPDPTTALQTIDSLLNNSVAPNVALQLSSNVPDSQSQLSPVYAASGSQLLNSSQISPSSNRQPPYSNLTQQQSFSMLNYGTTTQTQTTAQSQQQVPQQAITRMSSSNHSQYQNTINPCVNQQPQTQSVYLNQTQPGVWTQQQRLTLHQQQNPMLNAQLQVTGFNNGSNAVRQNFINTQQQSQQQGRVLTSPVSYTTEVVPANNNCSPQQQQQQQQHQLQFRMPRSVSISTPTNVQIPGGNNSVTEFTRNELRAFVGVRSQQQGGNARLTGQLLSGQNITPTELDPLSLNFDMSPTGGSESPKWSGMNSDLGASSPQSQGMASRAPVDDSNRTNNTNSTTSASATDQKSSLLQKLLSE
ncbi:nuclear receptor coactivator 2-like isoform X2 [Adelges cooleyi]|uniref:nuclear receptor coactivator 2-like isoform X2 n=1 Tax=Adelges cooleyi TaxID=133065 RepID=UPI00217F94C1|nr:nuclear receptor coactivator 2-like isoform X2 [Adelges cooleyi]